MFRIFSSVATPLWTSITAVLAIYATPKQLLRPGLFSVHAQDASQHVVIFPSLFLPWPVVGCCRCFRNWGSTTTCRNHVCRGKGDSGSSWFQGRI